MKILYKIIGNCGMCPYYSQKEQSCLYASHLKVNQGDAIVDDNRVIPYWCPLPDVESEG